MVENARVSEYAWLFVASNDNWQRVVNRGSFGVKPKSPSIRAVKEAQLGEPCVAFVSGQKFFAGLGKITRGYYYDKTSDFPHRVGLEVKLNLAKGAPLDSAKNVVQFIKDKNNPGKDLRRAMRRIPLSDYEVIKARLKPQPKPGIREESEKLAEREGHELISIPIEPIDTHTKAEGALLELGNLLGYDTYVTADDRNKKYRDIPLAEIAKLQELPSSIAQSILNTVRHIDVIWFKEELPEYCIEVEHSTDITRGLLRLYQLRGLKTSFMVVAPAEAQDKFEGEAEKAPFHSIRDIFRFKSYDELTKFLAVAQEFTGGKQDFFGQ